MSLNPRVGIHLLKLCLNDLFYGICSATIALLAHFACLSPGPFVCGQRMPPTIVVRAAAAASAFLIDQAVESVIALMERSGVEQDSCKTLDICDW